MNHNGPAIIERIRKGINLNGGTLADDAPIGVRSAFAEFKDRKETGDTREVTVIATMDEVDADGEVVLPGGAAKDSYFFRNKRVFVDHYSDTAHYVASMRDTKIIKMGTRTGWQVRVAFLKGLRNPLADDVWAMCEQDGMGVSIGFMPSDRGDPTGEEGKAYPGADRICRAWDWLELSFTPFPCLVSAQTMTATSLTGRSMDLAELVTKGRIRHEAAVMFGVEPKVETPAHRKHFVFNTRNPAKSWEAKA